MGTRNSLLDLYRFVAAVMVVIYHYAFNGVAGGKVQSITHVEPSITMYGYLGVELFFMISGFVIYNSVINSNPSKFITSRMIRLFPAYWFCLIVTTVFTLMYGYKYDFTVSFSQVLMNFTMVQQLFGVEHVDGVYWTLTYELIFYILVFTVFFIGNQNTLQKFFVIWPGLIFISYICGLDFLPFMGGYFYFFCSGVVIAMLCRSPSWYLSVSLFFLLLLTIQYSLSNAALYSTQKGVEYSPYIISLIIAVFFFMMVILKYDYFKLFKIPLSEVLGKITYPLYLIHAHIGYMLLNMYASDDNKYYLIPLLLLVMIIVSYKIHKLIEVRMHKYWKIFFFHLVYVPLNYTHNYYTKLISKWIKHV